MYLSLHEKALPCMMDPVIKGLSFESPCRPSLGNALLINPERRKKKRLLLSLKKEHN